MLKVDNLVVHYGAIKALRGISFEVNEGEIITLIGSNGAGKTTTLHAISNIIKKTSGSVSFDGTDITAMSPDHIVKTGLVQVPEGRRIFANLTVRENLEMGAYTRKDRAGIATDMEKVYELFPRLKERIKQVAGTLSGGEQQMLAIGRALMTGPRLLISTSLRWASRRFSSMRSFTSSRPSTPREPRSFSSSRTHSRRFRSRRARTYSRRARS